MIDETDRKFYVAAKAYDGYLVTGNKKHYLLESFIVSPAQFLNLLTGYLEDK